MVLTQYRWSFLFIAIGAIVAGFYLNYIRARSAWISRLVFWVSSLMTAITVLYWGWWRAF